MKIVNIAIHHSGTIGSSPYVSSAHLTVGKISDAHKERWDFPSQYMTKKNGLPWYAGYNFVYDPKDRSFVQTRAIGEETAAQTGFNFDTISICIIGNFTNGVDKLSWQAQEDVTKFLHDLLQNNRRGLFVAPGTELSLSISRVWPHRHFQQTKCYGDSIPDNHFRELLIRSAPPTAPASSSLSQLEERNKAVQALLQVYMKLLDVLRAQLAEKQRSTTLGDIQRCCSGAI